MKTDIRCNFEEWKIPKQFWNDIFDAIKKAWDWCIVSVSRKKKRRSLDQNEYYWGVVLNIVSKELGYQTDEMHEVFRYKFLQDTIWDFEILRSTKDLSTTEFEDYLEEIRFYCNTELWIYIPLPNEPDTYDYY